MNAYDTEAVIALYMCILYMSMGCKGEKRDDVYL